MTELLAARGLVVRLGGRDVVDGVDLTVSAGEVVGVIGPNGSGKSTLLRCLYGAQRPVAGAVTLHGRDLSTWTRPAIAREIAVVAQEPPVELPLRVEEVVLLGRLPHRSSWSRWTDDDREAAAVAIAHTDIVHLVGRAMGELSGGERQRVRIARALAQRTGLVLWDEPTNHLDLRHAHDGLGLLRDLGLSGVVVLHELNLAARYCDRLVAMDRGEVVAQGPPEAVCTPEVASTSFGVAATSVLHEGVPQLLISRRDPRS